MRDIQRIVERIERLERDMVEKTLVITSVPAHNFRYDTFTNLMISAIYYGYDFQIVFDAADYNALKWSPNSIYNVMNVIYHQNDDKIWKERNVDWRQRVKLPQMYQLPFNYKSADYYDALKFAFAYEYTQLTIKQGYDRLILLSPDALLNKAIPVTESFAFHINANLDFMTIPMKNHGIQFLIDMHEVFSGYEQDKKLLTLEDHIEASYKKYMSRNPSHKGEVIPNITSKNNYSSDIIWTPQKNSLEFDIFGTDAMTKRLGDYR